jgi:hypothetical protein
MKEKTKNNVGGGGGWHNTEGIKQLSNPITIYNQMWLNFVIDDYHLNNILEMKKN